MINYDTTSPKKCPQQVKCLFNLGNASLNASQSLISDILAKSTGQRSPIDLVNGSFDISRQRYQNLLGK